MGDRIQRTVSGDGAEIAGRVYGQGPPLVLVHGALDDGELDWGALVPLLEGRFTCYVMSTRGRGLSGDGPDHSLDQLVGDVAAFAESVGEPVGLVGLSSGGMLCLGAAARTPAVSAVAAYEPIAFDVMSEGTRADFQDVVGRMAQAAAEGKRVDAAGAFLEFVSNDEELAALSGSGAFEVAARHVPVDLQEFEQVARHDGPLPTDPATLKRITAPVLLLHGARTALDWFTDSVRHAARHVPNAEVRELAGAGHLGPIVEPAQVADELVPFFRTAVRRQ